MTLDDKPTPSAPAPAWLKWVFWIFAAVALFLLVAEHRAHAIGWALHGLLALCVVLLYLVIRADERPRADSGRRTET